MKNLLLIVDPQNDFFDGGSLEVKGSVNIIPNINNLIKSDFFDHIVVTLDYHPADHRSFASQHGKELYSVIDLNGIEQVLWPDHCVQNTNGAEIHSGIELPNNAIFFKKGMDKECDSYSGFYDNSKTPTGLTDELNKLGITNVFVCGLAMDYCCKFTALDSKTDGFNTFLITDATMPVSPDATDSVNDELLYNHIYRVSTDAIMKGKSEIMLNINNYRFKQYDTNKIHTDYANCISDFITIVNALK